jgi:hypothetical protein
MPKFNAFVTRQAIKKVGLNQFLNMYASLAGKYDVANGKKFANTEAEIDDVIKDVPELLPAKAQLIQLTRNMRVKAGLPE